MSTSAKAVADEFRRRIPGVRIAKVHKLLYYAQGHHLADLGVPLFRDTISAWDMGPVVGSLWFAERNDVSVSDGALLDEAALNTIAYVVSRYGGLTGSDLIRLSHTEQPWLDANAGRPSGTSVRITTSAIREQFLHRVDEDESEPELDAALLKAFLARADPAQAEAPVTHPDTDEALVARLAALSA